LGARRRVGNGKVLVFGTVIDKDGTPYSGDLRGAPEALLGQALREKKYTLNAANEIEGFLFAGRDAEKTYHETGKFEFIIPAATIMCCPSIAAPIH